MKRKRLVLFVVAAAVLVAILVALFGSGPEEPVAPAPEANATPQAVSPALPPPAPEPALPADNGTVRESIQEQPEANATEAAPQAPPEDKVVQRRFVEDLARLVVEAYFPAGTHPDAKQGGVTLLSVKTLNMRYGTELVGLAHTEEDVFKARGEVLDYVLRPEVLSAVYHLYAGELLTKVGEFAKEAERDFSVASGKTIKRRLNADEREELHLLTASWLRGFSNSLAAVATAKDLKPLAQAYLDLVQKTYETNAAFIAAMSEYQNLNAERENKGSKVERSVLEAARKRMDAAGEAYQTAIVQREKAKEAVMVRIKPKDASGPFSEADRLYTAMWVHRRTAAKPERMALFSQAAELLKDLAYQFGAKAAQGF